MFKSPSQRKWNWAQSSRTSYSRNGIHFYQICLAGKAGRGAQAMMSVRGSRTAERSGTPRLGGQVTVIILKYGNIEILFFYNEQLRRRLVQYFCWWLFVWDISYVWTVAVKTGGSLTCWRQKLLGTVAGGFPLVTGVKIPRRERNVGKFPQIFRAKVGRTKNMKIPAVLTSVCNTVIVSIFRSFNLCIIPLSLLDISINVSVWRGSHSLSVKSKCSLTNVPTCN